MGDWAMRQAASKGVAREARGAARIRSGPRPFDTRFHDVAAIDVVTSRKFVLYAVNSVLAARDAPMSSAKMMAWCFIKTGMTFRFE
jgi:hypothetical protein